jgi:hypothetical protein
MTVVTSAPPAAATHHPQPKHNCETAGRSTAAASRTAVVAPSPAPSKALTALRVEAAPPPQ